jgi:hypothetical protein
MTDDEQANLNKVIDLLGAAIPRLERLEVSHGRLLAAARKALPIVDLSADYEVWKELKAAIAAAEEQAPL